MRAAHATTMAALLGLVVALTPLGAHADADPALGYLYGSYALPYGASWRGAYEGGQFVTGVPVVGDRSRPLLGLENGAVGFGIGYDGLNAQLDLRSIANVAAGTLTFGYRLNLQFGNLELWTRFGVGPLVAVDFSSGLSPTGGIATDLELGLDYFVMKEFLAIGLKAVAVPTYRFPLVLTAEADITAGLRLIL
jgi:hypothetical protein